MYQTQQILICYFII